MSFGNFLLRTALGNDRAPDHLDVALYDGRHEIKDPGYKRAAVNKGQWQIINERALTVATFGPFQGTVTFDRSVMFRGDTVVHEKILPGDPRTTGRTDVVRLEVDVDLKENV